MSQPKNELLAQREVFELMTTEKLSPNQYYLLCSMYDKITPHYINIYQELRLLKSTGWVVENKDGKHSLTPKAHVLIKKIEHLFNVQKMKTSTQILGVEYKDKIKKWRELFPNRLGGHNKPLRGSPKNIEKNMRWFFDNHDYTWDTIMKATAFYIDQQESKDPNHKYTRQAHYFIRKSDGIVQSDLANYCELIQSGGEIDAEPRFKSKVV